MQNTKEKLLAATLKLVSKRGYLGATTREIAKEAGVTELTLFRHFGSKEKLFEKVLDRYSFVPTLKELLPKLEKISYDEALKIIGMRFFETLKKHKSMIVIMLSEINLYPEKIMQVHNRIMEELRGALASYLAALHEKGIVRHVTPKTAATAFLGMIFSYFRAEEIIKGRNISRREMEKTTEELVSIFVHGTSRR